MPLDIPTRALLAAQVALGLGLWCAYQGWDNAKRLDRMEKAARVACVPEIHQSKADARLEACAILNISPE